MITTITCPDRYVDQPGIKVFIAGGISNCPNWQEDEFIFLTKTVVSHLSDAPNIVLINPRRDQFDVNDPLASDVQIEWEHDHLNIADIVGTHPEYQRRFDVIKQLSLIRPYLVVHSDIHAMVRELLAITGMGAWHEILSQRTEE